MAVLASGSARDRLGTGQLTVIVIIKLVEKRRDGTPKRVPFETAAFDSKEAIDRALDDGATIAGKQIIFDKGRPGEVSIISGRIDKTITRAEVLSVYDPQGEFADAPGAAA